MEGKWEGYDFRGSADTGYAIKARWKANAASLLAIGALSAYPHHRSGKAAAPAAKYRYV
jgi:hypothetical protein